MKSAKPSLYVTLFSILISSSLDAACPPAGSGIVANGTTVTENGCTITTVTNNNPGAVASVGGTINFSNGSITTSGLGSYGAFANGAGTNVNLADVAVTTALANGLFVSSGQMLFNGGSVLTTGNSVPGAQLMGTNSLLTISDVTIQVDGNGSPGVSIQLGNNTANITNCTITSTNTGGRALDIGFGAAAASSATLTNCLITVDQGGAPTSLGAIVVRNGSAVLIQDSTINSEVHGVHTLAAGASSTIDNSVININSPSSVFGAFAQNSTTITVQNNTVITTAGAVNTHGFVMQEESIGNLFNSSVSTSGTTSQGFLQIALNLGNQGTILNSSVSTSGIDSNAIRTFANPGITNTIDAENSVFSAANANVFRHLGGIANINFTDVSADASTGFVLYLVDGPDAAVLNWTVDTSSLSGDIQVIDDDTANVTLVNSVWTGAALDVTNLEIDSSFWGLNANSTITNQLTNSGIIDFVSEGNIFKTLTVSGPYIGQGGVIGLNTLLEGDVSPSDLLIIDGGTATGSTFLNIKNTTGQGQQTVGNGILVVEAINGGTTAAGAFSLANLVAAGPYRYRLYRGSFDGTGPENWYLRSALGPIPDYRPQVSLYAALPSMALFYGRALLDTLDQRVGVEDEQFGFDRGLAQSISNRFWIRSVNVGGHQDNEDIFHDGPDFHYHFHAIQMGIDLYRNESLGGNQNRVGILGAAGHANGTVDHFSENAGQDDFDVYTAGAYWTHFGETGWYLDGVLLTNFYRNIKAQSADIPALRTNGVGFAGSLEGGYAFGSDGLILEPQAQIVYQNITIDDTQDIISRVNFNTTSSTAGRLGLCFSDTAFFDPLPSSFLHQLTLWMRASVWYDFQGNSRTLFPSDIGFISFTSRLHGSWFQGDLGLTAQLDETVSFYGSLGGNVYLNGHGRAYTAIAGLRTNF